MNTHLSVDQELRMEGLIKGLVDVAIGHNRNDNYDDEDNDNRHESRDERSRSTWAQVVAGEDDDENRSSHRSNYEGADATNEKNEYVDQEGPGRYQQDLKGAHATYRRGEYVYQEGSGQYQDQKEDETDNNKGWETVGKKHPRQHHKVHMDYWNQYKRPPSEQTFSDDVQIGSSIEPSDDELADLSLACNRLWELDLNRLVPEKDYQIDCGEGKRVGQREDMAQGSLFTWVSEDVLRRPTYSRFCSLLDNYDPNVGAKEHVTNEERQEQAAFIEEISRTAPIKYLHKYLSFKGIVSESYQEFKDTLRSLWFDLYSRGGTSGSSSAFEHVFVGEINQKGEDEVTGFHNWLQFYIEEAEGRVDYQGYIFPRRRGEIPDNETQLLTIQFEWNGVLKSVSSTFIGVSPEFEFALYTLCFYVGEQDNYVELGPYTVNIKCYHLSNKIGSVFPIAEN